MMVRDFQSVIGREAREQCRDSFERLPDCVVACVGGGSNAAGMFYPFIDDDEVRLVGVEAGGRGAAPGDHASPLSFGSPGVLHGSYSYVMQDDDGQTCDVHSMSAGLDYPGVGPEHSYWKDTGRVDYLSAVTTRPCRPLTDSLAVRASSRHSKRVTRSPRPLKLPVRCPPTNTSWSACRDAVTRMPWRSPVCVASRGKNHQTRAISDHEIDSAYEVTVGQRYLKAMSRHLKATSLEGNVTGQCDLRPFPLVQS